MLKGKLINNTIWSILGQGCHLIIVLVSNMILSRILTKEEFGEVGIVMFFVLLSGALVDGGLGGAVVRCKRIDTSYYSTIFLVNFFVSLIVFVIFWFSSDYISVYYDNDNLSELIKLASFIILINSFAIVQNAKLIRELKFKTKSIINTISILLGSIIGIIMAKIGYGAVSIISVQLLYYLINSILLWLFVYRLKSFVFNKVAFKEMYSFGMNTTLVSIINTTFDNINNIIIGKFFSIQLVGIFYQAKKVQAVPGSAINVITQGVIYSTLAKLQSSRRKFNILFNNIYMIFISVISLITIVLFLFADNIIVILLGDNWLESVAFMRILSIASFFYFLEMFNKIVFKIFDQTRIILNIEMIKKIIQILTIIIGVYLDSIMYLLYGLILVNLFSFIFNFIYSRRILDLLTNKEVIRTVTIIIINTIIIICFHFFAGITQKLSWWNLFVLVFILILYLIVLDVFNYLNVKLILSKINTSNKIVNFKSKFDFLKGRNERK